MVRKYKGTREEYEQKPGRVIDNLVRDKAVQMRMR